MNNLLLDMTELRQRWAVDDMCDAIAELTQRLESIKDIETIEAVAKLLKAMSRYMAVIKDEVATL